MKAENHKAGRQYWPYLRSAAPWILFASLLTLFLHDRGWLDSFETTSFDFAAKLRQPIHSEYVTIVDVGDDDYSRIFDRSSPLDATKLRGLIEALVALEPRVIGVDIDTSAPADSVLNAVQTSKVRIVWGQTVKQEKKEEGYLLHPIPVLGGAMPQPEAAALGITALPPSDNDGAVRRYARRLPVPHRTSDSLPWSVVQAYCLSVFEDQAPEGLTKRCEQVYAVGHDNDGHLGYVLPFAVPPRTLAASSVLSMAAAKQIDPRIKGKIVMLGGTFREGGDYHATASGDTPGVHLMSRAAESEMQVKLITPVNEILMIILELLSAVALVTWHYYSSAFPRNRWMPLVKLVVIPASALLLSFCAFFSLAYWINFILVFVSVMIHELVEHYKHHRHLVHLHEIDPH